MDKSELQLKVEKNRSEINNILHQDWSLELIYIRINMLKSQNESLIEKIKKL